MYGVYMITNISEETLSVSINRIHNTRCYEILLEKGLGLHENSNVLRHYITYMITTVRMHNTTRLYTGTCR